MKKVSIFILTFLVNLFCFGQIKTESDLNGKWIVKKIIDKPTEAHFKPVVETFENATFDFKPNHHFKLTTTHETELSRMMTIGAFRKNVKWHFDKSKQLIRIGKSLMLFKIIKNDKEPVLHLEETELNLLLKKIE